MFSNNHSHTWAGRLQPRDPCVQEVASDTTWGRCPSSTAFLWGVWSLLLLSKPPGPQGLRLTGHSRV